jgi:hypothetical protein
MLLHLQNISHSCHEAWRDETAAQWLQFHDTGTLIAGFMGFPSPSNNAMVACYHD